MIAHPTSANAPAHPHHSQLSRAHGRATWERIEGVSRSLP